MGVGLSQFGLVSNEVEQIPKFTANETKYVLVESLRNLAVSKHRHGSNGPPAGFERQPRCVWTSVQLATELCFRRVPWKYPGRITMA